MTFNDLMPYLPLLIPLVLLDLGLKIAVWIDIFKQPKLRGPKRLWALTGHSRRDGGARTTGIIKEDVFSSGLLA